MLYGNIVYPAFLFLSFMACPNATRLLKLLLPYYQSDVFPLLRFKLFNVQ